MSDSQQQPITFQSKFAARKAQEDKAFLGLYGGGFPNQEQRISGDLGYSNQTESKKTSLTQDATAPWDRQRLTSAQNVVQNQWVSPNVEHRQGAARQTPAQTYQPLSNSTYSGKRLAGSSSNSRLNNQKAGFDIQGRDYRATMQVPGSSSLNYDENDGRYAGAGGRFDASRRSPREPGPATMRGRSSDAVPSGQYAYRFGQETPAGQPTSQVASLADQLLNGQATYNLYNYGNDLGRNLSNIGPRNKSGRTDFSLEHAHERSTGHSASVGKPALGAYGYSGGAVATRKLEYTADARTAPFEIHTKDHFGRNSHPVQTTNEYNRVSGKYGDYRVQERGETSANKNIEEVADGYTEYFSQGCDYYGQLGHGQDPAQHDRNRHVNVPKSLSFDILIKQVSCGGSHTLILSKQGELFSIGSNEYGQLGLNDRQLNFTTAPLLVQEVQSKGLQVLQIASGQNHSLVLAQNGQVYSWGSNVYGQCGLGKSPSGQNSPTFIQGDADMNRIYAPHRLRYELVTSDYAKDVLAGENFSGFLTAAGDAFTFGDNSEGQLGVGSSQSCLEEPRKVKCDDQIVQASLGYQHMLLLTRAGRVLGAGRNREHQLGLGSHHANAEQGSSVPVRIDSIREVSVLKVVAGGFSAALIQNAYDRQLVVWGQGDFGIFEKPQKLYMDGVDFVDVQIGKFSTNSPFAIAIEKSGKVYSWGSNTLGQLGHGDQRVRKLPTQIQSLKRKTINKMSVGHNFVVMLGRDVSQAEQEKKKLKRKMQKEAKERDRQQRNKAKAEKQDENRTPIDINGMDAALQSKERGFERRDSNQPATPKLPGESARDSLGVLSSGNGQQESYGRGRPKSANQTSHAVLGIIDEMAKVQNKGQGLLERVKNLKERSTTQRSGRSGFTRDGEPIISTRETRERSANAEDSRGTLAYKKSLYQGPTKSASFGKEPTDHDEKHKTQDHIPKREPSPYAPKPSYLEKVNADSGPSTMDKERRLGEAGGYQPLTQECAQQYRAEIQDLRHQLLKAQDATHLKEEINDLKYQLQRVNQEKTQLEEDYRQVKVELDQERVKHSNYQDGQSRQLDEVEQQIYQKDQVLNELRVELADKSAEHKDAKQTIMDQNSKIQEVEQSYDQLKHTYEGKFMEMEQEKIEITKELDDAALKNQHLMNIVKEKQNELHETKKIAEQAKTMKKQLSKLEDIIEDLQVKNKELNELLNRRMVERANNYKQEVVDYLNRRKSYDDGKNANDYQVKLQSEKNHQYRRLGEEVARQSHNEKSFQDYREKDESFVSKYGQNLHVSHSIALPERQDLFNQRLHNSDKKQTRLIDHNGNELHQNETDQEQHDSQNFGVSGEQKTRSLPRNSKINKMSSPQFFHNDRQEQVDERGAQMKDQYDYYANEKVYLKSDYVRNGQPIGESVESPFQKDSNFMRQQEPDINRSKYSQREYQERDDNNRRNNSYKGILQQDQENRQERMSMQGRQNDQEEIQLQRVVTNQSFPDARQGGENDLSRSKYDPESSMGRPPLTGQRISERDAHQSAERRHQRNRSGNYFPPHSGTRVENQNQSQIMNDSRNNSRVGYHPTPGDLQTSQIQSDQRSAEEKYTGRRAVSNPGNGSYRAGSREALSIGSRDQERERFNQEITRGNTTQSKTRKEYVDISNHGSEVSDRNRKVHRIDLAQDDQEDIQKQIQSKLTRIQKIFQGQQIKQVGGTEQTSSNQNSNYNKDERTNSMTGNSKIIDDTSLNDRMSQPTKNMQIPESTHLSDHQYNRHVNNGQKTPVSDIKTADFEMVNLKSDRIPISSSMVLKNDKSQEGYVSQHERRKSSNFMPVTSQRQELEGGSYQRPTEVNELNSCQQQQKHNSYTRPGEMRYSYDNQNEVRD